VKFSVVATFTGVLDDDWHPCDLTLSDVLQACAGPFGAGEDDLCEIGDSEYDYLAEESGERDPEDWFAKLQDLQVSGILDRPTFDAWVNDLGAFPDGCPTLGTLGGPISLGCVWDTNWEIESQLLIASIRVTPLPDVEFKFPVCDTPAHEVACQKKAERIQQRLERAILAVYR
jgi:hypothetical protein